MSIGTSLSLSVDCATDVDTNLDVYSLQAADLGKSVFSVAGLTPPEESLFTISHEVGKNGEARHLIRSDRTKNDAYGVPATLSVYLVIVRPNNSAMTNALCLQSVNELVDFCIEGGSNANITKVLNNEV